MVTPDAFSIPFPVSPYVMAREALSSATASWSDSNGPVVPGSQERAARTDKQIRKETAEKILLAKFIQTSCLISQ
jgi:hypothetical protein